ncbi:MAG: methionyl-tRNA formyltransferase [Bacilli bacterium]|nr:methionyl-tRNA formyltransferase [Bacilli bacterium]MDD3305007.1 methionyl-tRNA formyltransferase [Bacilli bacterium]MDD4053662.1 methionyl-tRNA formyltransferase [Bacilli bacterium]MDD4411161.1 methionyl-tRNA formyltransferase [Bacilli bacterium]
MKNLKVIFMGTPSFSVPVLDGLIEACTVIGIVSQPDRNGNKISPVKEISLAKNIPLFQPENIKTDYQDILRLNPDIIITCAYGQIIPKQILVAPRFGCVNIHASLLPKYRGGAPIHRAIMNGESKTGITIMLMNERMDAGSIIRQKEEAILSSDNVGILHDRLSILSRNLLISTLPDIISGNIDPIKQNEAEATFASIITREDEHINFSKTTREVYNNIRGLNPWPGAYCVLENKVLKVWNSRIGDGIFLNSFEGEIVNLYEDGIGVKTLNGEIVLTEVQLEGHKRMNAKDFLNGLKNKELLKGKICD